MPSTPEAPTRFERPAAPITGDTWTPLVERLNRQSVSKHFDAYLDVDWDSPNFAVHPDDARWQLRELDPLGATSWYRNQPVEVRARIGLHRVALSMRTGWEFENVLQRGLLRLAYWMANGRPEFRYLHHEVAEESQHTMMFQEFVNRTGIDVAGMPWVLKRLAEPIVIPLSRVWPPMFFLFVLGGEEPIDHIQRHRLRTGIDHPLVESIMRIHVTEEARHLSFARNHLKQEVPRLGRLQRTGIGLVAPVLFGIMARLMLDTPRSFARANGIPEKVRREAVSSPAAVALRRDSVAKVRRLCTELGLMNRTTRALWRWCGVGDAEPSPSQS